MMPNFNLVLLLKQTPTKIDVSKTNKIHKAYDI